MIDLLERTKKFLDLPDPTWHKKAIVIQIYHISKTSGDKHWTIADTARDLNLSKSYVSESIILVNAIGKDSSLAGLSRNKALEKVRA